MSDAGQRTFAIAVLIACLSATQAGAQAGTPPGTQAGSQAGAPAGTQAGTQAGTPAGTPAGPQPGGTAPGRRSFDAVIGVIGDRVILQSTIDAELRARTQGRTLDDLERKRLENDALREIAREEIWVQYGKVLGQQAPEAFEEIIERETEKKVDELVALYGSFAKTNEELEAIGTSLPEMRESYRKELLRDIAHNEAVVKRIRNQIPLLVTPHEMREYYDSHAADFAARTEADIAWVSFPARDEEHAARVVQAAAAWRSDGSTAEDLAERFGGVAMPTAERVRPVAEDPRAEFLRAFARDGQEGDVSEPLRIRGNYFLLRIARKLDQPERGFDDPTVQQEIRRILSDRSYEDLNMRVMMRNSQKLLVWPSWLLTGS